MVHQSTSSSEYFSLSFSLGFFTYQLHHFSTSTYVSVFFLDCPKMYFQDFQKTHFLRYFLQILKFGPGKSWTSFKNK